MKVAIIGSRELKIDISKYVPNEVTEIISGGAKGIDSLAEAYADENNIPKRIIKPFCNQSNSLRFHSALEPCAERFAVKF